MKMRYPRRAVGLRFSARSSREMMPHIRCHSRGTQRGVRRRPRISDAWKGAGSAVTLACVCTTQWACVLGRTGSARLCGGGGRARSAGVREDVCELQRMYLAPMARGRGVGRLLLRACLDTAQSFGYRQCYLETAASLHQANHLYESAGFRRISEPPGRSDHLACDAIL